MYSHAISFKGRVYTYNSKKRLIQDFCEAMQTTRSTWIKNAKQIGDNNLRAYPVIAGFILKTKNHGYEMWNFRVEVSMTYKIVKAQLSMRPCIDWEEAAVHSWINYFQNDGIPNYNVCKNITEFREFLTREIDKEEESKY